MQRQEGNRKTLFYAWTDTQIINAVNTRLNKYQEAEADLLVYGLDRVSGELIQRVKRKQIFYRIYILEKPEFCLERKRKGVREKAEALFLGSSYRRYFATCLEHLLSGKNYAIFLTGAFWSESLLVIRYLKKKNPKLEVWFYEDGLADYNGPSRWLFQGVPNRSILAKIRTFLYYGTSSLTYRKYVRGIYLYQPRLSNIKFLNLMQLPMINREGNKECFELCVTAELQADKIYQDADIICIADAPNLSRENPMETVYRILDFLYMMIPKAKIVLKLHPVMKSLQMEFWQEKYPGLSVDRRAERIEEILLSQNIDDKLFIAGNSSSVFYLKWVYGKNPYIILVDFEKRRYVSEYKKRFAEEDKRVKVVKCEEEFNMALSCCFKNKIFV